MDPNIYTTNIITVANYYGIDLNMPVSKIEKSKLDLQSLIN